MPDLSDVPEENTAQAQQRAVLRLHVWLTGETHRLLTEFAGTLRDMVVDAADDDGTLATEAFFGISRDAEDAWSEVFTQWVNLFQAARREAVAIPFGRLAREHMSVFPEPEEERFGRGGASPLREQVDVDEDKWAEAVFDPQLRELMDAAAQRTYSDGFQLSERIWKLEKQSLDGIRAELQRAIAEGDSALNTAKKLEQYLGAGRECPRWTSTRLNTLSKKAIAGGDETGLIRGNPCSSKGVAYNALRLARNEIQIVHHMATDRIMQRAPWIEKEQIKLSAQHPKPDECDDIANGGEDGEGIYKVGSIALPIHVQCLCYKVSVQMDPDEFARRLRGWTRREQSWSAMDTYSEFVRGEREPASGTLAVDAGVLATMGESMVTWLYGSGDDLALAA